MTYRIRGIACRDTGCGISVGSRHSRLTILGWQFRINGHWFVVAECDCSSVKVMRPHHISSGHSTSCGCVNKEITVARSTTHGYGRRAGLRTRLYRIWSGIKTRCTNRNSKTYADYGGRGIGICDEWQNFERFKDWAEVNGYRDDLTIDRIDNDGNYKPENCRWVTPKAQCQNRRSARLLAIYGKEQSATAWSQIAGVDIRLICNRLQRGWSHKEAVFGKAA